MGNELRERLAAYAHEAWSGRMKYLFSKGYYRNIELEGVVQQVWIMPGWARQRWERQMNTPYADLPEVEKESDHDEADKMLAIVGPGDMPLDVRATMREALESYKQRILKARELYPFAVHTDSPERIDAALAWLDALP